MDLNAVNYAESLCVNLVYSSITDADVRADPQQVALVSDGKSG